MKLLPILPLMLADADAAAAAADDDYFCRAPLFMLRCFDFSPRHDDY